MKTFTPVLIACVFVLLSCDRKHVKNESATEFIQIETSEDVKNELSKLRKLKIGDPQPILPRVYVVHKATNFRDIWAILSARAENGGRWIDLKRSDVNANTVRIDFALGDGNETNWQFKVDSHLEPSASGPPVGIDEATSIRYMRLDFQNGIIRLGGNRITMVEVKEKLVDLQPRKNRVAVGVNVIEGNSKIFELLDLLHLIQSNGCKYLIRNCEKTD